MFSDQCSLDYSTPHHRSQTNSNCPSDPIGIRVSSVIFNITQGDLLHFFSVTKQIQILFRNRHVRRHRKAKAALETLSSAAELKRDKKYASLSNLIMDNLVTFTYVL